MKTGVEKEFFWSEKGSGFGGPGGTYIRTPRIFRSTRRGCKNKRKRFNASASFLTVLGALTCLFSLTTCAAITMQERE